MTHICVGNLTIIGSDNGLSPDRRQAIIWTNAGLLLIWPLGTNFIEILIEILTFSFKKMRLKVSSAKRRPFCLGLNVLSHPDHRRLWYKSAIPYIGTYILKCIQTKGFCINNRLLIGWYKFSQFLREYGVMTSKQIANKSRIYIIFVATWEKSKANGLWVRYYWLINLKTYAAVGWCTLFCHKWFYVFPKVSCAKRRFLFLHFSSKYFF